MGRTTNVRPGRQALCSAKRKWTEFQRDVCSHARALRLLFTCSRDWAVMGVTILADGLFLQLFGSILLHFSEFPGR